MGIIAFSSATSAPTAIENIQTSTEIFVDTKLNEVNGKLPKEEEDTTKLDSTESPFDKRFDSDERLVSTTTSQPWLQMQIPSTSDAPVPTHEFEVTTDNAAMRMYQTYQDILRQQIFRTFLTLLMEIQQRQMQSASQQEVQESQIIEISMPYFNPSAYKFDVSTNGDDGKVIVFDENSGSYVYLDRKLLIENQQNESHVSVIQKRIESR